MDNDLYLLLRDKIIIKILDGDTQYEAYRFSDGSTVDISMPYLSGARLCEISNLFGLYVDYRYNGGALSRWEYLSNLIEHCVKNKTCSSLLSYLFSLEQFSDKLYGYEKNEIELAYEFITNSIIERINGILLFSGNELIKIGKEYLIQPIKSKIEVSAPKIKVIDREYIRDISSRAFLDIEQNNYDSAITKSRTLLEETFYYVIEQKCEIPDSSGDIMKLYKQVRELYNMHTNSDADKRINKLLSGLNTIVSSIAEMRNKDSDAHGVGSNRISIRDYHARLLVNSSIAMSEFIISVQQNNS